MGYPGKTRGLVGAGLGDVPRREGDAPVIRMEPIARADEGEPGEQHDQGDHQREGRAKGEFRETKTEGNRLSQIGFAARRGQSDKNKQISETFANIA